MVLIVLCNGTRVNDGATLRDACVAHIPTVISSRALLKGVISSAPLYVPRTKWRMGLRAPEHHMNSAANMLTRSEQCSA